jgi:hypothetical protein
VEDFLEVLAVEAGMIEDVVVVDVEVEVEDEMDVEEEKVTRKMRRKIGFLSLNWGVL